MKSLNFPNKINDVITDKLKEIVQLQNKIKLDDLEYTTKRRKHYNFSRYTLPITFLRDMHEGNFSLKEVDEEQIQIPSELKDMGKGIIPVEKITFQKNAGLLLSARENA